MFKWLTIWRDWFDRFMLLYPNDPCQSSEVSNQFHCYHVCCCLDPNNSRDSVEDSKYGSRVRRWNFTVVIFKTVNIMLRKCIILIPTLLLLVHATDAAFNRQNENYQRYRNNFYRTSSSSNDGSSMSQASARTGDSVKPEVDASKGNKSLSAWGIIAIVVGVILVGTGGYYAFVFYPYLCKRERNYDMIELTNVL